MMDQPGLGTPAGERCRERGQRQVPVIDRADRPPDDEAGEEIEDRGQVQFAALTDGELRRIADPAFDSAPPP
jgi:hypothetical protein